MEYENNTNYKLSNGNTPSKLSVDKNAKRFRFDGNRSLDHSSSSNEGDESDELRKERERNRDLQFQFGKLQKKINDLTEEVKKLTNVIVDLQNEKKQLFEMLNKKSPPKSEKRNLINVKKTTNRNITQAPKQNETNTPPALDNVNTIEGDKSLSQAATAQVQQTQPNAQSKANEQDDMELSGTQETKQHDNSSNEQSDSSDDEEKEIECNSKTTQQQQQKHSLKVPPVDIWTEKRAEIQRQIQDTLPINSCLFSRVNNAKFRVFPSDASTRSNLIEFLKQNNIEYNTYTPNNEKMINVLIKGLEHIDDGDVIRDALAAKGFEPLKVTQHITGYMRKNHMKSNLWHIILQPNTDTTELFKIKAIDNAIIKFDFLRKPKVIQCRRCQRFNHSASNCSLPYRCVKCTDNHEPGQCKSETKKNKFKPKCVNCQGNHTANDAANCAVFKRAIEVRANKQKSPTNKNSTKPTNKQSSIRTSQSYAERVKSNSQQNKTSSSTNINIDQFINNQNKMLSDFMSTMQKMQQQFVTHYLHKNGQ